MYDVLLSLRFTLRDWRAGELRLLVAALLVAVAAIASVGFGVDRMRVALEQEAAQLLGADLLVGAHQPLDPSFAEHAQALGLQVARSAVFPSMALADGLPQLAAVKAVSSNYPLRGRVRVQTAQPVPVAAADGGVDNGVGMPVAGDAEAARAPADGEVWLDPQLAQALGVSIGDAVRFGERSFRLAALITFEPDRGTGFVNFAPRAMFALDELAATRLVQPASRVRWNLMLAGDATAVDRFRQWAEPRLPRGARVESLESGRPELRATLDRAERFLSLVALLSALIAAVAIGLAARARGPRAATLRGRRQPRGRRAARGGAVRGAGGVGRAAPLGPPASAPPAGGGRGRRAAGPPAVAARRRAVLLALGVGTVL